MRTTRPETWPLYIAEVHGAALAVDSAKLIGEPLPGDGGYAAIQVDPAAFENQLLAPAVGFDQPAALRFVEGFHGAEMLLRPSAAARIGLAAAKRGKDGTKRAEALKTVDADW